MIYSKLKKYLAIAFSYLPEKNTCDFYRESNNIKKHISKT